MLVKNKKTSKIYRVKDNCPVSLINLLEQRSTGITKINFDFYKKNREFFPFSKTIKVFGKCEICKKDTENYLFHIQNRKLKSLRFMLICKKCIPKQIASDKNWLENNRNSQKIVQSREENKKRMSEILKETWKCDKVRREKWINSIAKKNRSKKAREKNRIASIKNWEDEEYRKKVLDKVIGFSGISGVFKSKFSGNIRFDSSYELFFLFFSDIQRQRVERVNFSIPYFLNGKKRYYRPDYIKNYKLFEIKSLFTKRQYLDNGEFESKNKAAIDYIDKTDIKEFVVFTENELKLMGNINLIYHLVYVLDFYSIIKLFSKRNVVYSDLNRRIIKCKKLVEKWSLLK